MKLITPLHPKLQVHPYLYRIELLDRLYKMLDNKELIFVRPERWSDPLENLVFNATILKSGKPYVHPAKKKIYGQCWSYEGDSYALWQIYTNKANDRGITCRHIGVRIVTHLDRLNQLTLKNMGRFYFGMVNYLWKKDILKLPKDKEFIRGLKLTKLNDQHLKTLLIKRRSYSYENEVRLLAVPGSKQIDRNEEYLCRLKIEPTEFISSIRLDPVLSYEDAQKIKEILVDKYGFHPRKITHSSLGKKNKFVFNLDEI